MEDVEFVVLSYGVRIAEAAILCTALYFSSEVKRLISWKLLCIKCTEFII